ncbi:hypothetical protein B0A55_11809 [Friedmanniomyces simplex]|uniref:DUF7587 domain-containing protein n=1 Tax=Friedmanniomyces simplex TaxID=329884 RepID=A0A4V5NE04_9PEZI|nr:hypothetical protein B0A55_11809 [Friedmanniomyces simplex]
MDAFQQLQLREAQVKPRFLFRAASDQSRGVNTAFRIDPLALPNGEYHQCLGTMTWPVARSMLEKHLKWDYSYASEFSSWSVSLLWVLTHAVRKTTVHLGHVANANIKVYVLDTQAIDVTRVHRARNLVDLFGLKNISNIETYSQGEYLIHGRLQDVDGFKAVRLGQLITAGLYKKFPGLMPRSTEREYKLYCRVQELRFAYSNVLDVCPGITSSYRQLGSCFGESWEAFMTLAFVSIRHRETGTAATDMLLADFQVNGVDTGLRLAGDDGEPENETCQANYGYDFASAGWDTDDEAEESNRSDDMIKQLEGDW